MTEFALIAPLLFLLLFGVIQIGLLMASQNGLVNGVRDTARRAATYRISQDSFDSSTFAAVCGTVETNLATHLSAEIPGFRAANLHRTISYQWGQNPDATYFLIARVSTTYDNPLFLPLDPLIRLLGLASTGQFQPGTFPLSASEQMRVENPSLSPSAPTTETCAT